MSLINQALRKAQHQRSPNTASTPEGTIPSRPPSQQAAPNNKSGLLIGLVAGIALLIGIVAGLLIVLLRSEPAPAIQQTALPKAAPAQAAQQSLSLNAPVATNTPTQTSEPVRPGVLEELRIAREATEAKAAAEARAAQEAEAAALAAKQAAEAAAAAKPSQDIIHWLAQAKISGVRLSGNASKVILNNKAYSVGDTVNASLKLKVMAIQENRILFIGPNGKKYLKQVL